MSQRRGCISSSAKKRLTGRTNTRGVARARVCVCVCARIVCGISVTVSNQIKSNLLKQKEQGGH